MDFWFKGFASFTNLWISQLLTLHGEPRSRHHHQVLERPASTVSFSKAPALSSFIV